MSQSMPQGVSLFPCSSGRADTHPGDKYRVHNQRPLNVTSATNVGRKFKIQDEGRDPVCLFLKTPLNAQTYHYYHNIPAHTV